MNERLRNYCLLGGYLVLGALIGRFLAPTKTVTVTKTVEVEKKQEVDKTDTISHTHTVTTTKRSVDGSEETKSVSDTGTEAKDDKHESESKTTDAETRHEVSRSGGGTSVYGLAELRAGSPAYGVGLSQHVLGSFEVGVFGFPTVSQYGIMIGVGF